MPPQAICDLYKKYQRLDDASVDGDLEVVDFRRGLTSEQKERITPVGSVSSEVIGKAQKGFKASHQAIPVTSQEPDSTPESCTIYEHKDFDGSLTFVLRIRSHSLC